MSKFVTTINRLYAVRRCGIFYRDYIILNDVIIKSLQNEAHNNELLAAACAVGVSSNFGAPIGGSFPPLLLLLHSLILCHDDVTPRNTINSTKPPMYWGREFCSTQCTLCLRECPS